MFLPLGDSPNPRGTPVVNYLLIAINVAVYALVSLPLSLDAPDPSDPRLEAYLQMLARDVGPGVPVRELLASISAYDLFVFEHGFRPAAPSLVDLGTSMFLHGGLLHLAGNMLFLWIYGDNVEHRLGRLGYLVAYLGTGAAATLIYAAFAHDSGVPTVGASGAISGAMGFYFLFFPHNEVRVFVALFPFLLDVVTVPARLVLGLYLLIDNLLPILFSGGVGGGGVAHGAHIGGFVAGVAVAWLIDVRERKRKPRTYRGSPPSRTREPEGAAGVARLLREGAYGQAAQVYFAGDESIDHELAPADAFTLARWLEENGHPAAALSFFRRVLRRHASGRVAAEAHLGAGLVQLRALGRPTSAWQHFHDAVDLDPDGDTAAQARRGLEAIEALQGYRR